MTPVGGGALYARAPGVAEPGAGTLLWGGRGGRGRGRGRGAGNDGTEDGGGAAGGRSRPPAASPSFIAAVTGGAASAAGGLGSARLRWLERSRRAGESDSGRNRRRSAGPVRGKAGATGCL